MPAKPEDFLESPPDELELSVVSVDRIYQTSNIIIQDPNKDGILSFLSENTRYNNPDYNPNQPTTNPTNNLLNQQGTGNQQDNTGGY